MLEELQSLIAASKLTLAEIAAGTGLSISIVRGIKSGDKPNPTINTYAALKKFLEAKAAERDAAPPASNRAEQQAAA